MYRTMRAGATSPSLAETPRGDALIFYVNGQKVVDERPDPELYLGYYLRQKLNLRGTKLGCNEGQCGSCTIMLSKYDRTTDTIKHSSVNACLVPIAAIHGCAVTTVEGVGTLQRGLHPVQERLSKGHGSQCGFCTPGFIMAMYALLRNKPKPTKQDIELNLQGNLCRCTGYRPILESFYGFTQEQCPRGSFACCKNGETNGGETCCRGKEDPVLSDWSHCRPYDPSQEPIFPPELSKEHSFVDKSLTFAGPRVIWFRPTSLAQVYDIASKHPDAVIAATYAWSALFNRTQAEPSHKCVITTMEVAELKKWNLGDDGLFVGAGLTIDEMHRALIHAISITPGEQAKFFEGMAKLIPLLGHQHLRNFVAWVGNVASGFPTSDLIVCLLATGAILHVAGPNGNRTIELDSNERYFKGAGKVELSAGELVTGVTVPLSTEHDKFHVFKQGQRHGPDGSTVNAAMRVTLAPADSRTVQRLAMAFGGLSDRPVLAEETAHEFEGKHWDESLLEYGTSALNAEVQRFIGGHGFRVGYRTVLCLSFFRKFFELVRAELDSGNIEPGDIQSLIEYPHPDPMKATQIYHDTANAQSSIDPIGRPIMVQSGQKHTTGEAIYTQDIPALLGECHVVIIHSERAHAKITKVDTAEALKVPGVLTYLDAKDIPPNGTIRPGLPFLDEPIYAEGEVLTFGQIIGAIVAEDQLIAQRASRLVKVHYEDLPVILSAEDAIAANSMFPQEVHHKRGEPPAALFPDCHLVLKGELGMGFQEHFYMETQNAVVIPRDGDEYEVYSSTQALSFAQHEVAAALGIPAHKVIGKLKRIGGGFGGKQTDPSHPLWSAALAARKLKRPARCALSRHDDFAMTGKRHQIYWYYEVGVDEDGRIKALDLRAYINGGWNLGLSEWFLQHHLHNIDHCYNIPNLQIDGYICKTNLPSSTAMRGFGKIEGHYIIEEIVERVARSFGQPTDKIKEINFYKKGETLLNNQVVSDFEVVRCWEECKRKSDYENRRSEVDEFNSRHQWKKRGLAIVPVFWAQGEQDSIIEQGGVLVTIYRDGSVAVSHGGTEMGQGLNTKVLMAAANALNIPFERVTTIENGTDKVPNAVWTGGSIGTDVYCRAAQIACKEIMQRLEPYTAANPKGSWDQWIAAAFFDRCSLAAYGHCKMSFPDVQPHCPGYYVSGAAASLVEVDCLTGDHRILRSDLVMDIGETLNPAIDIGQIEGAFMQGVGLTTTEELLFDKEGKLITTSSFTYKIPSVATVPREFNVSLLKNESFKQLIFNSKAVGEPPLSLGFSVHFAVKDAILAFRRTHFASPNASLFVDVGSPLTPEKIRLQMHDRLTEMVERGSSTLADV